MPVQVAKWDSARDAWTDESRISLFSGLSDAFLGTFPTSGMTVSGVAYALPTWEPATDDSASSSLLPTVTVSDTNGPGIHGDGELDLRTSVSLLPTPTTQDGANNGGPSQFERNTPPLNTRVLMLPTPKASDGEKGGPNQKGSSGDLTMPSAAVKIFQTPSVADTLGGHERRGGKRGQELLLNGEVKALVGASMSLPSDAGNESLDDQLQAQRSLLDAMEDTA